MSALAVTWWGHSSTTVELGSIRIGTDPLLADRLMHLRRYATTPDETATEVDLVLISHAHGDHLHLPSVARTPVGAPVVVPRGVARRLGALRGRNIIEVEPGDRLEVAGVTIDVLPAHHDGRRHPLARHEAPALGFRVADDARAFWYPGDTGLDPRMSDVAAVDLALVPIGGWGPTLGDEHLDPDQGAEAVARVGARWAVPVHYGTFWPAGLRRLNRANHHRLFVTPGERFVAAMSEASALAIVPGHGERVVLHE